MSEGHWKYRKKKRAKEKKLREERIYRKKSENV